MADPTTRTSPAPVVSAREALEFLTRAGFVLADSLDYEQTLARVVDLVVPQIADWCGVYIADGDGTEREITSRHADPGLERMLVEIRRAPPRGARRFGDPGGPPQRPLDPRDRRHRHRRVRPDREPARGRRAARSALLPHRPAARPRARARRAHPALDPRGPPLPRPGRRIRRDARRALRAGDRQREPLRGRRALPSACSTRSSRRPRSGSRSSTSTATTSASTRRSPP